jgi:hypothetical protein
LTTVYLDPVGTAVTDAADRSPAAPIPLPGALEALARLCEARYDVVVLASAPPPGFDRLTGRITYDPHPLGGPAPSERPQPADEGRPWLIASDRGWSELERPRGIRTIRVGPRLPPGRRTGTRFDLEARDLPAAVLEILVRDTMP